MALTIKKSITLTGESKVTVEKNDVTVVTMTANIHENGGSTNHNTIINKELYEANKEACRADMDEFTAAVREIEDAE